jgi:hypothetical protein
MLPPDSTINPDLGSAIPCEEVGCVFQESFVGCGCAAFAGPELGRLARHSQRRAGRLAGVDIRNSQSGIGNRVSGPEMAGAQTDSLNH